LVDRWRRPGAGERMSLRAQFVLELARRHADQAQGIADSAARRFAGEAKWYRQFRQ
jgi:hypothetical protein